MALSEALPDFVKDVQQAVEAHSKSEDGAGYDEAITAIRRLQLAVERPGDFAARFRFQALQNTAFVMLTEMGVIQAIVARDGNEVTADMLAAETGCAELLIVRLLRLLTAVGVCDETNVHTYRSNRMTEALGAPGQQAGVRYMVDFQFAIGAKVRDYMRETQVHRGQSAQLNACQFAMGKSFWRILDENLDQRNNFNAYMGAARRGGQAQLWHERFPPVATLRAEELKNSADAVLMVDVGGGVGAQVGSFRKQYPGLPGRCVLQDLPDTIKNNPNPPEGVECMSYDFFTPQPIKGARMYLFRSVCHDWTDEKCRQLLGNTVRAMDPAYSRLLIDEWVLPDCKADLKAANMDINMMLMFDAMERTRHQWETLLDEAGLEIIDTYSTPGAAECIIEARVKANRVE